MTPLSRNTHGKPEKDNQRPTRARAKRDRRVLRTRDTLGDALFALMREKNFDEITVQDLLDRAGVGRSTFYVHYKDKNDLLLSDVEEVSESFATALTREPAGSRRLVPVEEFFTHIRDAHEFYLSLVRSGKYEDVHTLVLGLFARSIEKRLQRTSTEVDPARRSAQASALAGSFLSLLDWWIDKGMKADPREMDDLFHRMAWNGLA